MVTRDTGIVVISRVVTRGHGHLRHQPRGNKGHGHLRHQPRGNKGHGHHHRSSTSQLGRATNGPLVVSTRGRAEDEPLFTKGRATNGPLVASTKRGRATDEPLSTRGRAVSVPPTRRRRDKITRPGRTLRESASDERFVRDTRRRAVARALGREGTRLPDDAHTGAGIRTRQPDDAQWREHSDE